MIALFFLPLLVGQIPRQNAKTVQDPSGGQSGSTGTQATAQGVQGNQQSQGGAAAVPAQPGLIQDAQIYVLDPRDPENTRVTGVQLREGWNRIRGFDSLQSDFHRLQNENEQLRANAAQMQQDNSRKEEEQRMVNLLRTMGYFPNQGVVQPTSQQSTQVPTTQSQGLSGQAGEGDWMDFFSEDNQNQQQPNPTQRNQQNPGSVSMDPQSMVRMFSTLMEQNNQKMLGQLQKFIPSYIDEQMNRRSSEQDRRSGVQNTFTGAKQNLISWLGSRGYTPDQSRDISDKLFLTFASADQARQLMNTSFENPDDQFTANQTANERLSQGLEFFKTAVNDAVNLGIEARNRQVQEEASNMLETGSFVPQILGDLTQPQREVWDPNKIEQIKQQNAQKAGEIAETVANLQRTMGAGAGIFTR